LIAEISQILSDARIEVIGDVEQCVGRAYTVNSVQDSLSTMQALDDLQAFLAFLNYPENDIIQTILMIASDGAPYALAGGMCTTAAKLEKFGGVKINPGDLILADKDGIVVMNKEEAVTTIMKAEEIQTKEIVALQKIQDGIRFNQICNIDENVENLKAGIASKLRLTI
jgi:regulator of RNase E activity RraA